MSVKRAVFVEEETNNVIELGVTPESAKVEFEEKITDSISMVSGKNLKLELVDGKSLVLDDVLEFVFGKNFFYYVKCSGGTQSIPFDKIRTVFLYSPTSNKWRRVLIPKFRG